MQEKLNKGEKFQQLVKQVESLSMATRLNQLLIQKMGQQMGEMAQGISNSQTMLNDFQYRLLALQKNLNVNVDDLQAVADALKLEDFTKASDEQDADGTWDVIDTVETNNDTVIITSTTPGEKEDKGILRSRITVAEMQQPELQAKLIGAKTGDVVVHTLNGCEHHITILGVRRKKTVEVVTGEKTA